MGNPISKLCANTLPGVLFNSAISSTGQLAIESRTAEATFFSVFDLKTGELLSTTQAHSITPWHSLVAIDDTRLILRQFENKQNPDQVSFIRYNPLNDQLEEQADIRTIDQPVLDIPSLFLPESEGFQKVGQFLNLSVVLGCEYAELGDVIIVSYYLTKEDRFERKLLVLENGNSVLDEVQDKKMSGFAPGSFFTHQNRLIFVKEKIEINIYEI